jgi:hypothetical protein
MQPIVLTHPSLISSSSDLHDDAMCTTRRHGDFKAQTKKLSQ